MSDLSRAEKLEEINSFIKKNCKDDVSITDICALAELMVGTTQSFYSSIDSAIYKEIRELADYIETAKSEITKLQANDMHEQRIPDAGKQLDAIVQATEDATNRIMEQAEAIMMSDPSDTEAYQACVNNAVMEIFEACSFQDITGQRISKVVETLQHIDVRVGNFLAAVKATDAKGFMTDEEAVRQKRKEDKLLNGPALEGEGIDQNEVDDLIGGMFDAPADAKPEVETEAKPETNAKPAAKAKPVAQANKQAEAKPAAKASPKAEAKPESKAPAKPAPKPIGEPLADQLQELSAAPASQSDVDALFD